jgi:hypothetical protein
VSAHDQRRGAGRAPRMRETSQKSCHGRLGFWVRESRKDSLGDFGGSSWCRFFRRTIVSTGDPDCIWCLNMVEGRSQKLFDCCPVVVLESEAVRERLCGGILDDSIAIHARFELSERVCVGHRCCGRRGVWGRDITAQHMEPLAITPKKAFEVFESGWIVV